MTNNASEHDWVSLREAANILGVHPATVRNWSDRGELPTRRTPGGHRRFRRSDLQQWVETSQSPPPAEVQMLIQNALGRMRLHISDGAMKNLQWYGKMDDAARQEMRDKGRAILEILQKQLAESSDAVNKLNGAQELGEDYAQFLIDQGLTLSQAMQGFLLFSDLLHEAVLNIMEVVSGRAPSDWLSMLRQVRRFNNEMLLSLTQVYEELGR